MDFSGLDVSKSASTGSSEASFYSFVSEEEVHGPGFVIYRSEAFLHKAGERFEGTVAAEDLEREDQYDLLEGYSVNDRRVTQFLLSEAKSASNLPALWSPLDVTDCEEASPSTSSSSLGPFSKRRTKQLSFTCKLCGTRMTKLINPHAWENGAIVILCDGCGVKHQLVDNLGVFDLLNQKNAKAKQKKPAPEEEEEREGKAPPRHLRN